MLVWICSLFFTWTLAGKTFECLVVFVVQNSNCTGCDFSTTRNLVVCFLVYNFSRCLSRKLLLVLYSCYPTLQNIDFLFVHLFVCAFIRTDLVTMISREAVTLPTTAILTTAFLTVVIPTAGLNWSFRRPWVEAIKCLFPESLHMGWTPTDRFTVNLIHAHGCAEPHVYNCCPWVQTSKSTDLNTENWKPTDTDLYYWHWPITET